jgi:protease IV
MTERKSFIGRLGSGTMRGIETTRRILGNLVFIVVIIVVVVLLSRSEEPTRIHDGTAVVFNPVGWVVEEYDAAPLDRAMNRVFGSDEPQVLLRDLRAALLRAAEDERVDAIVFDLRSLAPVSLSKLEEIVEPLAVARANGKRVIAYADFYGQSQYLIAAHADEVHMNPMGGVLIEGYGSYRMYMREAMDKLSIDWHVFRTGDYKSFAENYERDDMSEAAREQTSVILDQLWARYQAQVESARGLEPGSVSAYIDGMVAGMTDASGDFAEYAQQTGFVDSLTDPAGLREHLIDLVGTATQDDDDFLQVGWQAYLASRRADRAPRLSGRDRIALLVARGSIVEGDPGQHVMGAGRIMSLIRDARDDDRVKALVMRVDSGGGSAFASEQIRAELQRFRDTGRPVVVSMSSVAASGGYWISMASDEVWAAPATITGSIGVVGMFPNFTRTMDRLGLHADGVGTTPLSDALRVDMPLSDAARNIVQVSIESTYADFIDLVASARGMDAADVLEIAGGRVWTGADADGIGLVDRLGTLDDAVESAAGLAGLDEWAVRVLQREPTFRERLLMSMLQARVTAPLVARAASARERPLAGVFAWLEREFEFVLAARDPRHTYLYCFCDAP